MKTLLPLLFVPCIAFSQNKVTTLKTYEKKISKEAKIKLFKRGKDLEHCIANEKEFGKYAP